MTSAANRGKLTKLSGKTADENQKTSKIKKKFLTNAKRCDMINRLSKNGKRETVKGDTARSL